MNEEVQCDLKKGDSVNIKHKSCVAKYLRVYEIKVYGTALLAIGKSNIINIIDGQWPDLLTC